MFSNKVIIKINVSHPKEAKALKIYICKYEHWHILVNSYDKGLFQ